MRTMMLVAGEPSGDALGARLMAALRLRMLGRVRFIGVGGELMIEQGLESLFPMPELSIMGIFEILPRAPRLLARVAETVALARRERPDVVITIDSPAFNLRVARRLRGAGLPLVHYVAPTVWAWRPGRAKVVASRFDHLMVLLPFEPPWFEREGLATTFVGHPLVESGADHGDGAAFRARHSIASDATLLAVLPGSRVGEVGRHLPVFRETVEQLRARFPALQVVMPTVAGVAELVRQGVAEWSVPVLVLPDQNEKYHAFAAADGALAASGTVTLELGLARTPTVIAYKVNNLSAFIARRLVTVRFVGLLNLLLDREVMPEFIQQACRSELLAPAVARALVDPLVRAAQNEASGQAALRLGFGGEPPSLRAADAVLRAIEMGPRRRVRKPVEATT